MAQRFEVRYDPWCGWLLGALGLGRRLSGVDVSDDDVVIRMGWAFRLRFSRSSIVSAERDATRVWGWGVHGWRRAWLVNGSASGLVRFSIDPAARGRVVLVPWHVDTVLVSVEEPDGLLAALS